jgi:hypothetical protein
MTPAVHGPALAFLLRLAVPLQWICLVVAISNTRAREVTGLAAVGPRPGLCRLSRGRCESDPAPVNKKVRFSKAVVPALCSGISRDAPDRLRDQELGHQSRDGLRVLSAYERGSDSAVRREHATDLPKPAA